MASGRKLNWRLRMDVPELLIKEQERREATVRAVLATRVRNTRKRLVPIAKLEASVQLLVMDRCLRRKWKVRKLVSPNVRGWPDLFVMDPATKRCAFVELKVKGRSHPVSAAQLATIEMLRECGLNAFVVWGADEALIKLEEIFRA